MSSGVASGPSSCWAALPGIRLSTKNARIVTPRMIGIASSSRFPIRRSTGRAGQPAAAGDPRVPVARDPREGGSCHCSIQTSSQMTWEFTRTAGIFVVRPGPWTPVTEMLAGAKARPNGA